MSKSADKCSPFFRTLKQTKFKWTEDAKEAFNKLKEYLASLPKLVSLAEGAVLILYISVSQYSISGFLVTEIDKSQFPVYYISHVLCGSKVNYNEVVKVLFAIVMASRKLKPYF